MEERNFDDIRPYTDDEVPGIIARLRRNKWLTSNLRMLAWRDCPHFLTRIVDYFVGVYLRRHLKGISTVSEFQHNIVLSKLMPIVVKNTIEALSTSGMEKLDHNKAYLYITNHRDIVLDSALLNDVLTKDGFPTTQIAFGDNLLINETVSDLIRINKSFIVKRNLPMREQIKATINLSHYIFHALKLGDSVWLAQREGRAKDGDDRTNASILKMLNISQRKGGMKFNEFIRFCNIVPVAISYEYDPCDKLKGWELHRKKKHGSHVKGKTEDLVSMFAGIKGSKGRVHVGFGEPLGGDIKNEKTAAAAIDQSIHTNYRLWPNNYIAYDYINSSEKYKDRYTSAESELFLRRYKHLSEEVRKETLLSYANPVVNNENVSK